MVHTEKPSYPSGPVNQENYYATYNGHPVDDLEMIHEMQRLDLGKRRAIFLAGDSSLDNKYWFEARARAINGYERILSQDVMKEDVCYWLNKECVDGKQADMYCVNSAVEATALNSRAFCLLGQDEFIRDHITEDDYLIVSVGGNDIALQPLLFTIINIVMLVCCVPMAWLSDCACACPPNTHIDCGCCGCGLPGCLSGFFCGWPPGLGYLVDLFKNRVENYVTSLVKKRKPKKVLICMIYYPDKQAGGSWADSSLSLLRYNSYPQKLQCAIRTAFRLATQKIKIPGTEVVAVPLFETLDGNNTDDYEQRVEPSPQGGRKMARELMRIILGSDNGYGSAGKVHAHTHVNLHGGDKKDTLV